MSNVKIYRITGHYRKGRTKIPISMDVRTTSEEAALERVYTDIGSRHYVKRKDIFIEKNGGITVLASAEEARVRDFMDIDEDGFAIPTE